MTLSDLICVCRGGISLLGITALAGCDPKEPKRPGGDEQLVMNMGLRWDMQRCPDGEFDDERKLMLERVCNTLVPNDGKIWTRKGDGSSCWCSCPGYKEKTLAAIDSARWLERTRRIHEYVGNLPGLVLSSKLHGEEAKGNKDTAAYRNAPIPGADTSIRAWGTLPIGIFNPKDLMLGTVAARFKAQYPVFEYFISEASVEDFPESLSPERVTGWHRGDPELPDDMKMWINFPRSYVDHQWTWMSSMSFFMGHELGHALGQLKICLPEGTAASGDPLPATKLVTEGDCDYWSALIALRAVYPDESYLSIIEHAWMELQGYYNMTGNSGPCGKPCALNCHVEVGCSCGHPPLECRLEAILAAVDLRPVPDCVRTWYRDRDSTCPAAMTGCAAPEAP